MGSTMSVQADAEGTATAPPQMPNFLAGATSPVVKAAIEEMSTNKVNYMQLPQPVKYEEIQREIMMSLRPDLFEGMRFEITRPLNQNFFLTHSIFMGNIEVPAPGARQTIKTSVGTYEFGANVIHDKWFALGRVMSDGRLSGRLRREVTDWCAAKVHMQLSGEQGQNQIMADLDVKGSDWNAQLKLGNPGFYGLNYFQSITPNLSAGGEFFYLSGQLKSGVGVAVRHTGEKHIAVGQVATTGIANLQYAHRVTDKITMVSDLLWQWNSREATATIGYDCILRQARLQGRIDTNGVVSCFITERFGPLNFLLSAEVDHSAKNYRFGFGFTLGDAPDAGAAPCAPPGRPGAPWLGVPADAFSHKAPPGARCQEQRSREGGAPVAVVSSAYCHPRALDLELGPPSWSGGCAARDAQGCAYFRLAPRPCCPFRQAILLDALGQPCAAVARPAAAMGTWVLYRGGALRASDRVAVVKAAAFSLRPRLTVTLEDGCPGGRKGPDFAVRGNLWANHFRVVQKLPGGGEREIAAIDREAGPPKGRACGDAATAAAAPEAWRVRAAPWVDAAFVVALAAVVRDAFGAAC
ncbi:MAG: eukaryotic porin-domain-containing protein [Monoraphidium minutum]|nr:MAG: eukaryotic porin-domain-containing protein [Monoraphidium minutum]